MTKQIEYLPLKRINALYQQEIQQSISEVIDSGWYLQGEQVAKFEANYAQLMQSKHSIACGNGLDALRLIIMGYKELRLLREGDEIITPANTYIATILAISETGLVPRLIEPRIDTFQIDDSLIDEAINERTRGIMIVHLYGYDAMTERIADICRRKGLLLIEDYAQAHGLPRQSAMYDDSLLTAQAHSFYPGKNLGALADAGVITTSYQPLADVTRAMGNYGSKEKYVFKYRGINSRMDEMTAAILSVKLSYLQRDNARRQAIAERYIAEINKPDIILPSAAGVHHIFPILTKKRDELQAYLAEEGIQTIIHYPIPAHKQECYKAWNNLSLPITEQIHREEISLPLHQAMTDEEAKIIIEKLNAWKT